MTRYIATVNTPGYLPETTPLTFDTPQEAWLYLRGERIEHEDAETDTSAGYSAAVSAMEEMALREEARGTIYASTPGYEGGHDLGLAYSVDSVPDTEPDEGWRVS